MLSLGAQTSDSLLCSKQGMNETARELRGGRRGPHVGSSLASAGEGSILLPPLRWMIIGSLEWANCAVFL